VVRDSQIKIDAPKETPLGFKFTGNPELGMEQGTFEIQEVEIVKRCLNNVDTFINIGANIGYYCCLALQLGKKSIAFEPLESNLRHLYVNIKANNWDNDIEIYPLALGHRTEIVKIYGTGTGASLVKGWAGISEFDSRLIPVTTLDKVVTNRLVGKKCLFLVDIEGVEKLMLQGASEQLSLTPKPIWMVEITTTTHQPPGIEINPDLEDTFDIFWENGYEAWTVEEKCRRISRDEITEIRKTGQSTFSSYNFLFMDKSDASKIIT